MEQTIKERVARGERAPLRIPELDGWRVLLVFLVALYHIWQQSWLTPRIGGLSLDFLVRTGYMPVDGTILLSGFLLYLPYARSAMEGTPMPSARRFYQRRIMRIVPSFVVFTLLMLFLVALPGGAYRTTGALVKDLAAHFTFTFTFFYETYIGTPLGAASWTICIEMQMYLLIPLIARLARKHPGATMLGMCAVSAYWKLYAVSHFTQYGMVVNQLASFLDVYVIGMACAVLYLYLRRLWDSLRPRLAFELLFTAIMVICLYLITVLLHQQALSQGQAGIQRGQLLRRLPYALLLAGCMVSLPFTVRPIRFLFGNRVMHALSLISMNFYLVHQPLAVQLKKLGIPASVSPTPNVDREVSWQYPYTFLCFGLALVVATLMTLLVEKPGAWALGRLFARLDAKRETRRRIAAETAVSGTPEIPDEPEMAEIGAAAQDEAGPAQRDDDKKDG